MLKIRWSHNHLIFNTGIPIPGKDGFHIETGPWSWIIPYHLCGLDDVIQTDHQDVVKYCDTSCVNTLSVSLSYISNLNLFIIVSTDVLAPNGTRPSAVALFTKKLRYVRLPSRPCGTSSVIMWTSASVSVRDGLYIYSCHNLTWRPLLLSMQWDKIDSPCESHADAVSTWEHFIGQKLGRISDYFYVWQWFDIHVFVTF